VYGGSVFVSETWLTPEQGRRLLDRPTPSTGELRAHAMVAMLIGCGVRRAEDRMQLTAFLTDSHAGYVMNAPHPSPTGHGGHRPDQSWCAVVPAVALHCRDNRSYQDHQAVDAPRATGARPIIPAVRMKTLFVTLFVRLAAGDCRAGRACVELMIMHRRLRTA
jgi:hypothetical protein